MRVDVLALDRVFDLGLSAVLDALQTANELIEIGGLSVPRFEVRNSGRYGAASGRLKVSPCRYMPLATAGPIALVVAIIIEELPDALERTLARPDVGDARQQRCSAGHAARRCWPRPASARSSWPSRGCSTATGPRRPGGLLRCSAADTRASSWMSRTCSCYPAGRSQPARRSATWISHCGSDPRRQPRARRPHREIPHRRQPSLAVDVRVDRSPAAHRSDRRAVRAVGAVAARSAILAPGCGSSRRREQA